MPTPKAVVLRTAGTNCDRETVFALEQVGFAAETAHVLRLMEQPDRLDAYQLLVVPGGFSYGDDVAAGKILANQMIHRLADALNAFVSADKLVLGICNGFQVLLKSGLLPWAKVDPEHLQQDATLGWNDRGRFEDRWVHLRCDSDRCAFLAKGEVIALPIAHGEGKFVPRDDEVLARLRDNDQAALRYCDAEGNAGDYPVNPNGSVDDVAGICDPAGRVLGLMPHPERFVDPTHHPQWTRREIETPDGRRIFERAFQTLA